MVEFTEAEKQFLCIRMEVRQLLDDILIPARPQDVIPFPS